jgi:hypothetical protein
VVEEGRYRRTRMFSSQSGLAQESMEELAEQGVERTSPP